MTAYIVAQIIFWLIILGFGIAVGYHKYRTILNLFERHHPGLMDDIKQRSKRNKK